jgi:hypothetical protein
VDRLGDLLRRRAAVAGVVLDAEILVGPPGLWLADRMMPPKALCLRMTWLAAGVDRMPPCPTITRPKPLAAAIGSRDLDHLAVVVAPVAADHERLAREALEAVEDRLDEVLDIVRAAGRPAPSCAGRRCRASGRRKAWSRSSSIMLLPRRESSGRARRSFRRCSSQETSAFMPWRCSAPDLLVGGRGSPRGGCLAQGGRVDRRELDAGGDAGRSAASLASITVSARPPVRATTGTQP